MTNAKALFMRPPEPGKQSLAQWWASIAKDDRFAQVVVLLMADAFEKGMSDPQMMGARTIIATLATFSDNEDTGPQKFPKSGLHHKFDVPKNLPEPPAPATPPTEKKA